MKRDMELIRQILQKVEALQFEDDEPYERYRSRTYSEAYQITLLNDAGLVEATINTDCGIPADATITRLTWAGHDFIDAVREDTIWNKIQKHVIRPGASWTFSLMVEYAKQEIKNRLFKPGDAGQPDL